MKAVTSRLGRFTAVQRLEEASWNRRMDRRLPPPDRFRAARPLEPHLLVVPHYGPGHPSFRAGTRNLYFEAAQVARERYPDLRVSVLAVASDEEPRAWHDRVIAFCADEQVTHLLAHAEVDPGWEAGSWTWDILWSRLSAATEVVFLGTMFDSSFRWITAQARRLARISPSFVAVDICVPMNGILVRGRPEVGPVNMPMSALSFELIDARIAGLGKRFDVSFIGALYPYRIAMIEELRAHGMEVAVNPHRPDATKDFESSRSNQPSFLDYMAGLAESELTVNFARSSAGPFEQLKTRVIEAASVGCLVLTDDRDRTRRFWPEGQFARFDSVDQIPTVATRLLSDREALRAAQAAARSTARTLGAHDFWDGIDRGLRSRGLRRLVDP